MVCLLLLALAGVSGEAIAADYALSAGRLPPLFAHRGMSDQTTMLEDFYRKQGTTPGEVLTGLLASVDLEAQLRRGGLRGSEISALRARLVE